MHKPNSTILIVDDEQLIAQYTAVLLEDYGYKTKISYTGEHAVKTVNESGNIDLILIDIDLGPGLSGPEAAQIILKDYNIPIVFVTSHSEEEIVEKVRSITRYGYVIKNSGEFVLMSSIEMAFELFDAHKALEKQLNAITESEKRHETFLNSTHDLAFLKNDNLEYVLINEANARFFNREKHEIIGKKDSGFLPDENAKNCEQSDLQALRENRIITSLETIDDHTYETTKFPVPMGGGKMGVGAYIRDITQQKLVENELKESEEKFRMLADSSPFAIMIYQNDSWVYTNPAGEMISGYSAEELYKQKFWEIVDPEDRDMIIQRGKNRQTGQDTVNSYEFKIRTKNNSIRWVFLNGRSIQYQGKPAGLISIADITDRKEAEEKLKLSERTYKDIINTISEAVFIHNPEGVILDINKTAETMYGYTKEEILGNTPLFLSAPGKNDKDLIFKSIKQASEGKRIQLFFWGKKKDGTLFPKEVSLSPGSYFGKHAVIAVARDISEREERESVLKESKARYKALFTNNYSVMLLIDPETGLINNANQAACTFYGWDLETLKGMNISNINIMTDSEIKAAMAEARDKKQNYFIFKHRLSSGEIRNVEVYSGPIEIGRKRLLYSIIHDITARMEAEAALREREEYLSVTLHSIGDAVIATDVEGKINRMNHVAEMLTGWTFEEARGRPLETVFRIINSQSRRDVANPVVQVLETGKTAQLANHTVLIAKDGTEYHIADSAAPIIDVSGKIQGIILVFSDMTEKYMDLERIRKSEHMLNTLISNLQGMVYLCKNEPGWPMEFVSPGSVQLTGYKPEDFYEAHVLYSNVIHPEDRQAVWETIQNTIREKKHFFIDYRIIDRHGNEKWVREQVLASYSENGDLRHLEGFISDITLQKTANMKIQKLLKEKELLLREVHHRTKNNMNIIASILSLQRKQLSNPESVEALEDAQNRIKTMTVIYDKLFRSDDYKNISSKKYLERLITNLSAANISASKINIKHNIQDILIDSDILFSVGLILNELITNSFKYAFPGNTCGEIFINFSLPHSNTLILEYKDTGIGMSGDSPPERQGGFGLKLVDLLVSQLEGHCEQSWKGGTRYSITFPIKKT